MGKPDLLDDVQIVALPDRHSGRRPFADPVHREDEGRSKGRGIIGRGRVRIMMFAESELRLVAERRIERLELAQEKIALKELLADPERHGLAKGSEAFRREGDIGLEQALEFDEGLFVKDDAVDRAAVRLALGKTIS